MGSVHCDIVLLILFTWEVPKSNFWAYLTESVYLFPWSLGGFIFITIIIVKYRNINIDKIGDNSYNRNYNFFSLRIQARWD